jgi:methylmalonyl-CoA mutase
VRAITIDARVYRDAGASAVDEIAYAVATGIAYLRALAEAGVEAPNAFPHIEFRVSATADQFLTIAALRALRRLWARVGEECGVPESQRGARVHAVTATRMFTREDPWVNVLRSTIAAFAAWSVGPTRSPSCPMTPSPACPRSSRGAWPATPRSSSRTRPISAGSPTPRAAPTTSRRSPTMSPTKAWTVVQDVEAAGGMPAALADGLVAQRIHRESTRDEEAARIATRREPITGVSPCSRLAGSNA